MVHRLGEVDTPAFREFLAEAVTSFQDNLKRLRSKPEDVMPWKVNGERWHLGEKGFPAGQKLRWDRAILPRLVEVVREVEPGLEVRWDARDAITLKVPGVSRGWAQWRTKLACSLECRFLGKKGQLNLARIEGLGVTPHIGHRKDGDVMHLHFQQLDPGQISKLKEVLAEHLRGFREVFGRNGD
jgi:excinuclease ABC subunit A